MKNTKLFVDIFKLMIDDRKYTALDLCAKNNIKAQDIINYCNSIKFDKTVINNLFFLIDILIKDEKYNKF